MSTTTLSIHGSIGGVRDDVFAAEYSDAENSAAIELFRMAFTMSHSFYHLSHITIYVILPLLVAVAEETEEDYSARRVRELVHRTQETAANNVNTI